MSICVIDYGSGNLHSVAAALERVAGDQMVRVTSCSEELQHASHIVLPGVGAFGDCKRGLDALPGMREALEVRVLQAGVPFLGICVGMQLMLEFGHEHGKHAGLGWIKGEVVAISPAQAGLKIPHMGWNEISSLCDSPVTQGLRQGDHAYFVHSFHAVCADRSEVLASVEYGGEITAIIGRDQLFGVQFHPEKSQHAGERVLKNFLSLR